MENGISDHAVSKDYKAGKHTEEKGAGLERIYSYVRPSGTSEEELFGMSNFRVVTVGDHGEDIYVVWTQAPGDESGANGSVELYATAFLGSEESKTDPEKDPDNEGTDWARPYRLSSFASGAPKGSSSIVDEPSAALMEDGKLIIVNNRYMQTITDDAHFSSDGIVTRAQVVTFLWRAAGCPEPTGDENGFTDVPANEYYAKAVAWAVGQGITKGTDSTTFSPDAECKRCQVVTFLYRQMKR